MAVVETTSFHQLKGSEGGGDRNWPAGRRQLEAVLEGHIDDSISFIFTQKFTLAAGGSLFCSTPSWLK